MALRNVFYRVLKGSSFIFKNHYKKRLKVLAYHDVRDSKTFQSHLKYLKKNYNIIDLEILEQSIFKNKALPDNPILITFDDGDYSVLEKGLPVLKDESLPAVLFIISGLINTDEDFWWSRVEKSLIKENYSSEEIQKKIKVLKVISNTERLNSLSKFDFQKRKQLSSYDLEILHDNSVTIANHSHSHPMFNNCTKEELELELKNSKEFFNKLGFGKANVFAYPNGNFDEVAENILIDKKIKMAFLFDHRINNSKLNPLRISRIRVNSDTALDEFISKVSGTHSFLHNLK